MLLLRSVALRSISRSRALATSSVPTLQHLIDGKLVASSATEFFDVHNPATGELL